MNTINKQFNPDDIPEWARQYPKVVERCKYDYPFRCAVCNAQTMPYKHLLINETKMLDYDLPAKEF